MTRFALLVLEIDVRYRGVSARSAETKRSNSKPDSVGSMLVIART